jgi:hypothetical protein
MVWGENVAERAARQRGNFYYGGSATGAQDAIDAARNNMQPYQDATMDFASQGAGYGAGLGAYGANYNAMMGDAAARTAPIADNYLASDVTGQAGQYGAANALMNFANGGPGPSAAQAQLQLGLNAGMNNQLALARSGRGMGESAASMAMAGRNQAQLAGTAQLQGAQLAAQEQQAWQAQQANALAQAGGLYGQGRASDISAANYYTGAMQNQTGLNDQYSLGLGTLSNDALNNAGNLQLGAGGLANSAANTQLGTENLGNTINTAALQGSMGYEQNLENYYAADRGVAPSAPGTDWGALAAQAGTTAAMIALA